MLCLGCSVPDDRSSRSIDTRFVHVADGQRRIHNSQFTIHNSQFTFVIHDCLEDDKSLLASRRLLTSRSAPYVACINSSGALSALGVLAAKQNNSSIAQSSRSASEPCFIQLPFTIASFQRYAVFLSLGSSSSEHSVSSFRNIGDCSTSEQHSRFVLGTLLDVAKPRKITPAQICRASWPPRCWLCCLAVRFPCSHSQSARKLISSLT